MDKICTKCGEMKPLDEFYKYAVAKDGHKRHCKECQSQEAKAYYEANREHLAQYQREYNQTEVGKQTRKRACTKQYQMFPEKRAARYTARNAVLAGKLVRPTTCSRCGSSHQIQAHHADYSKPLEIEWLCLECHWLEHKYEKEVARCTF